MSYCLMTCSDRLRRLHSLSRQDGKRSSKLGYTTTYTITLITTARSIPRPMFTIWLHTAQWPGESLAQHSFSDRYQHNKIDNKLQVFTILAWR